MSEVAEFLARLRQQGAAYQREVSARSTDPLLRAVNERQRLKAEQACRDDIDSMMLEIDRIMDTRDGHFAIGDPDNPIEFRRLDMLKPRQVEILRLCEKLHYLGDMSAHDLRMVKTWLAYKKGEKDNPFFLHATETVLNNGSELGKELVRGALMGTHRWLTPADIPGSLYEKRTHASLILGPLVDGGAELQYSGEKCLVTIAPPGSGKTECHVLPNLLRYPGPAVVLDVTGDCWVKTSKWRAENVGPVYRFDPLNPNRSDRYNPFATLVGDSDSLWEEAREMADLLIVPKSQREPFWESRARDLLQAILAWMARFAPKERQHMGTVLDVLAGGTWGRFVGDARDRQLSFPALTRAASEMDNLRSAQNNTMFQSFTTTLRDHLSIWEGEAVEWVTSGSDWTALDLRQKPYPTIYLCIETSKVKSWASMLRVVLGQHINALIANPMPKDAPPVLFMLDELPRLGAMEPVRVGLETGRSKGFRMWMFAQYFDQLRKAYGHGVAEGMVGSCGVRAYMNPASEDGLADQLSKELGFKEGILDDRRRRMAEAVDLTGPEFRDVQIVRGDSVRPAKLRKAFAHNDPVLVARMGGAPQCAEYLSELNLSEDILHARSTSLSKATRLG